MWLILGVKLPGDLIYDLPTSGLDWPLCRGTSAPFDEHRRPLAPSKFFDVCYGEKFCYRCGPLPTPLVVIITKLSLLGIPSKNSISL